MAADDAILERLAREVVMVDEHGNDLTEKYCGIIEKGLDPLPESVINRDVLVIGAGIAGLLTAKLLKDAGYNVTIIEANDDRIGGRIKTFRTTNSADPMFQDPQQYAEAGAMRIPTSHKLVNKLIDVMGLASKRRPFYNVDVAKDGSGQANNTWIRTNDVQVRRADYNKRSLSPETLSVGFPIPAEYQKVTANQLLEDALKKPNELIRHTNIDDQIRGWKEVIAKYDSYSMQQYLQEFYPDLVIDYIGTLQNLTSRLFLSFFHSFVDTFYIRSDASYVELAGGNWQLPYAFLPHLRDNITLNARASEIQWSDQSSQGAKAVHKGRRGVYVRATREPVDANAIPNSTLHGKNSLEAEAVLLLQKQLSHAHLHTTCEFTADHLVVTIPFTALRLIKVTPQFDYNKRRAIKELHYDSATKVLLEFSQRFWEFDQAQWSKVFGESSVYYGHNSFGGGSVTDSLNRFIYFPSHRIPGSEGGVVLASYTWSDDANRWDGIPADERYNVALDGLCEIYGNDIRQLFTDFGHTESWMNDYFALGEAAVFSPGQLTALHAHTQSVAGNVYFAGEHTSLMHAWIEGSLQSAVRVALEIRNSHHTLPVHAGAEEIGAATEPPKK